MSLSLFSKQEKVSLLVTIGSGAISAGLVAYSTGQKPTVIYSVFLPFKIDDAPEKNKMTSAMDSLLDQVLTLVVKNGFALPYRKGKNKHIHTSLVSFSSPWFYSKIKKIELKQDKSFVISHGFLNSILESEGKVFIEEIDKTKENSDNTVVIENTFTDFKINGYEIKNCFDQKTKNFSASLYLSAVAKSVADVAHNQLSKHFSLKPENISMSSFPLISFAVSKNLFPTLSDFLLVLVTAEMTDIVLVNKKSVSGIVSFPSGRNFIVRQIARKFGVTAEIAVSLLRLNNNKKSDDETVAKMQEILSDAEKEWSIYFENAFTELAKNIALPSTVCLTASGDVEDLYANFLQIPKEDETAKFRKDIQIFRLDSGAMSHLYNSDPKFAPNVFLSTLTIFSSL